MFRRRRTTSVPDTLADVEARDLLQQVAEHAPALREAARVDLKAQVMARFDEQHQAAQGNGATKEDNGAVPTGEPVTVVDDSALGLVHLSDLETVTPERAQEVLVMIRLAQAAKTQ